MDQGAATVPDTVAERGSVARGLGQRLLVSPWLRDHGRLRYIAAKDAGIVIAHIVMAYTVMAHMVMAAFAISLQKMLVSDLQCFITIDHI